MSQINIQSTIQQISQSLMGKEKQIKLALSCLLANGHLLIEDLPGMGKTSLSQALARTLGLKFSRVQFTSDLLPADLLGINIFDNQQQSFNFHPGPIFSQLLLADEINRASPKTQSALLEAMEENQVSLDGETHALPSPFFVIATQNPSHQAGTYPLPESQLDRFMMRIQIGYPSWQSEKQMLLQTSDTVTLEALINFEQLSAMQHEVRKMQVSDSIIDYILKLVSYSRENQQFPNALSPRASKALLHCAKSWAFIHDRTYVIPEDVQAVLPAIAEHRLRHHMHLGSEPESLSQILLENIDPIAA